ncbi:NAD(P)-dependent oxidoreductase [Shewanella algae]|nr:dTDP-4-dehydrorhamnose reductase [Shewanella algae]TVL51600.1 NAD(P)-dependent oxidoreductase [Shewanella algae]
MKILITGSRGQVGQCLVNLLSRRSDIEVIAYDREQLDITNEAKVRATISALKPDVIINAAAHTSVDLAETDICASYGINRDGPLFLAKAAQAYDSLMLHISTDYVFDGDKSEPYVETDVPNPKGVYGQSKLAGEEAVMNHCTRYAILRTAWVFGEYGNNFVKTMLRLGNERTELGIIGDQFGGPTYAGDIAKALVAVMDNFKSPELSGVYHYAGEPHVSWYQFSRFIFAAAELHGVIEQTPNIYEITSAQYPLPAPRPANSRLNCTKIQDTFGIVPSDWQAALENIKSYC